MRGGRRSSCLGRDQLERALEEGDAHRQLGEPVAVGVDVEGTVGVDLDDPAAKRGHVVALDVLALEDLREAGQEAPLRRRRR